MEKVLRPLSRLAAVELPDCDLDVVAGGSATGGNTDYYCPNSNGTWTYEGSKPDPD